MREGSPPPEGEQPREGASRPDPVNATSIHVRAAEAGDVESLDWVVRRFSPVLLAQAAYRLGPKLRVHCEPEDLVSEVWAIALPRLGDLSMREGRSTPVLMRFLATTLLYRVNDLVRRYVKGPAGRRESHGGDPARDPLGGLAAPATDVVRRAVRDEAHRIVLSALEQLDPVDREVIVLRAIEQNSNKTAALLLGLSPSAASMRYRRALTRIRSRLPASVFDEIDAD